MDVLTTFSTCFCHNLFFQTELTAQKEALDTEHCKALETLKKQVLTIAPPCF